MILFLSMYKMCENLHKEIYEVHRELRLSLTDIYKMPVRTRKEFIRLHNKFTSELNEKRKT